MSKSLWIKASAKCINVNVSTNDFQYEYWGIRFCLSIIHLLHDWQISLFVRNRKTQTTSCKRVYNVIILFCFEWENIGSELENYIIDNKTASWSIMCQKHCGLPRKFLLQPQSMILTLFLFEVFKEIKREAGWVSYNYHTGQKHCFSFTIINC